MFRLKRPKYHPNADFTIAERESEETHELCYSGYKMVKGNFQLYS